MSTTTRTPVYVDIHIIQSVPPSNLNRDDAGSPKQAIYGGARRARVSSQAWKRATRKEADGLLSPVQEATRTKKISALLTNAIAERTGLAEEQATRIATHLLAPLKIKPGKKAADTAYLLFFGREQLRRMVDLVVEDAQALADLDDKQLDAALSDRSVPDVLTHGHPASVALFGRMVADIPALNVDAATQVAHAISTHAVETEFDYFTAVDDENPKEDTGAGMIGTIEFNSATLYRFATVGVHQLLENLDGDADAAANALRAFITAFVRSMPTGHQNSFAHRTTPSLVAVVIRTDQPVNLVSAFETPVRSSRGLVPESMVLLARELRSTSEVWGLEPKDVFATYSSAVDGRESLVEAFGEALPMLELVDASVAAALSQVEPEVTA